MNSTWGKNIRLSVFGESHGSSIGVVIDGLPTGIKLDFAEIERQMRRRAPGQNKYSTLRVEGDIPKVLSGMYNDMTTGAPLAVMIENTNTRSGDYEKIKNEPRPGHSDYTAYVKYNGFNDPRGGGHFSGRLTTPLVFAGSVCRQILQEKGISIGSHIYSIYDVVDAPMTDAALLDIVSRKEFAVIDDQKGDIMKEVIDEARNTQNSVGGIVEGMVTGISPGYGNPIFHSVESVLSGLFFSIPAVKGVEFGAGFNVSKMKGSECNDKFIIEDEIVKTSTNNNGGILGGITSGMPITFKVAFKPTPSIGLPQKTVDISKNEETIIEVKGRHDPCIVPRAVVVVESMAAIGMLDLILE